MTTKDWNGRGWKRFGTVPDNLKILRIISDKKRALFKTFLKNLQLILGESFGINTEDFSIHRRYTTFLYMIYGMALSQVNYNKKIENKKEVQSWVFKKADIREEVAEVTETGVKTDFIGIASDVKKKSREGSIQVFIQVQGMSVTDSELAELKRLQEEFATKVDGMIEE